MNTKTTTDIITSLVINGDISRLTPQQKVNYYKDICSKLGLDPLLQPPPQVVAKGAGAEEHCFVGAPE